MISTNTCEAIKNGPNNITDFVFSKKNPKTLYVAGDSKLWISKDDGASWVQTQKFQKEKLIVSQ